MVKPCSPFVLSGVVDSSFKWSFRGECESAQTHEKKHVWSRRNRSSQASGAPSEQSESGQKGQAEKEARTTGGSSEETEEHEKRCNLSAYHNWDQQGCVRSRNYVKRQIHRTSQSGSHRSISNAHAYSLGNDGQREAAQADQDSYP